MCRYASQATQKSIYNLEQVAFFNHIYIVFPMTLTEGHWMKDISQILRLSNKMMECKFDIEELGITSSLALQYLKKKKLHESTFPL